MAGSADVYVLIAGYLVTPLVRVANLQITDVLNEQPNSAALTLNSEPHALASGPFNAGGFDAGGFATAPGPWFLPNIQAGQDIKIYQGGFDAAYLVFGGEIVIRTQLYSLDRPALVGYHLSCTDYTRALNRRKISKSYPTQSATAIVLDMMASRLADGFTTAHVAANLPNVAIDFTFEDMNRALTRLANRVGGYWYVDYAKDLHFFLEEPADTPAPIEPGGERFADLTFDTDLTQVRTRVLVEGQGSQTLAIVAPGDTMIPIVDPIPFSTPGGGLIVAGPQRIAYTGVVTPLDAGTLIGTGAAPTAAPALAQAAGSGVDPGSHSYAITFQTAAGESLPGPSAAITVGSVDPPSGTVPPIAGAATVGGAVDAGSHEYVTTFITAVGETTGGAVSTPVVTGGAGGFVTPPTAAPTIATAELETVYSSIWAIGDNVAVAIVYVNASGTTTPGPSSSGVVIPANVHTPSAAACISIGSVPVSADPTVTSKRVYYKRNGAWIGYNTLAAGATFAGPLPTTGYTTGTAPPTNTAVSTTKNTVPITNIPTSTSPAVTGRKLYRRFNGVSAFKLVTTIANNTTTTYTDTIANASLGAVAPPTNTANAHQVALSAIPIGPATVTARRLYRTTTGGPPLKLLATIADNTTTTYTDAIPDGSLGANAPATDTSGLKQPEGQIVPGATSIPIASSSAFAAAGGWAVIGNGAQAIRYTGVSGGSLVGIPSSGTGSIRAPVSYNTTITVAPTLVGVPSSGATAIVQTIGEGQDVNLLIVRDDLEAQAAIAAIEGGDGVIEHYIQDRRLSAASAATTADAELALFKAPEIRVQYTTRDPLTRTGKIVSIDLPAPTNLVGDFLIQRVQLTQFHLPNVPALRTVNASSTRFSFDDVLRRLELQVYA